MRKAESDRCSNSVLSRTAGQFRSPKRNSVDAAAIDGSRAHRVQAELILSIRRYGKKLRFVRNRLRTIGAQRLDQPQKYHGTVGYGAVERYMFSRVLIPFEFRFFDEKRP